MGVRKAFDDVLFPALRQQKAAREAGTEGEFQFPAALLSPVNWRLYLLGLERSNAHPHLIGQRMHLLHGLGVAPQVGGCCAEHAVFMKQLQAVSNCCMAWGWRHRWVLR